MKEGKYISLEDLCYLTDWKVPTLKELMEKDGKLINLFKENAYMRPGFCIFKRKIPNEKQGRIHLARQGIDARLHMTGYGIVLATSSLVPEDYDASVAGDMLSIGDVVSFFPEIEPKRFPVECYYDLDSSGIRRDREQDIWVMHTGDILQIYKTKENYPETSE